VCGGVLIAAAGQSSCLTSGLTKLADTGATLKLKYWMFQRDRLYRKTYFFTVVAKNSAKPKRQQGIATQKIKLRWSPVLQVNIECVANCGELMNPSYRLVLSAQCKVCHNMTYTWQLDNANKNSTIKRLQPRDTLNGLREAVVNVNKNVFATGLSETYDLVLAGQSVRITGTILIILTVHYRI